ncbi:hypothetical protein [Shouchella clausii]|uniref:hypothetical protein n=1 Tax=Shouchella clausii TaxID=79880 RepID=UPI001C73C9CA|nr:hypothetical protein [Shouchella clausii]MBX0320308.1 hypothetical protein [Shouchella clausii]MEB5480927.1 hypothetical protein [Shouchella clausii]
MTLDERIKYTSEHHNVSVENIHDALNAYEGDWPEEKTLEAIGVLGDGVIHGRDAGKRLTTISRWQRNLDEQKAIIALLRLLDANYFKCS